MVSPTPLSKKVIINGDDRLLSEEALIEYAKPYLKQQGFRKKNKRWTKQVDGFTL